MQIVSFRRDDPGDRLKAGFAEGGVVVASAEIGYPDTVRELLTEHRDLVPAMEQARAALSSGRGVDIATVRLGPPVPDPEKILCIGLNYLEHADEAATAVTDFPAVFAKFRNSLIGATDEIVMPGISTDIDYEAELAIVIGSRAKDLSVDQALDHVAGYSVFNDVSARDIQFRSNQWTAGKILDTFAPMGPGITPRQEIADVQALGIVGRVNGMTVQDSNTAKMIWPVAETVAYLSGILTLEPGDIIATGTPAGVGLVRVPPLWLKPDDVVEIEIEGLGMLRNRVAAAGALST
ncbi:fumarylacetoacetate hydrolase family protein [Amycolatopsis sp. NPDC049252]|uniref:fumarylacetoacetate hydrolase family protein n=1 Tax=Amycolatopsis sp. NPDC049252 TaxID=3363933 RepID=UPI0037163FEB